jgi:hypothetical protein
VGESSPLLGTAVIIIIIVSMIIGVTMNRGWQPAVFCPNKSGDGA